MRVRELTAKSSEGVRSRQKFLATLAVRLFKNPFSRGIVDGVPCGLRVATGSEILESQVRKSKDF